MNVKMNSCAVFLSSFNFISPSLSNEVTPSLFYLICNSFIHSFNKYQHLLEDRYWSSCLMGKITKGSGIGSVRMGAGAQNLKSDREGGLPRKVRLEQ